MASKKNQIKKVNQAIEDKTFGLKNKNKSKKVQQFVQGVETSLKNSNKFTAGKGGSGAAGKKAKDLTPDEELKLLLSEGMNNQFGKKKTKAAEEAKALGLEKSAVPEIDEESEEDDEPQVDDSVVPIDIPANFGEPVENQVEAIEIYKEKTLEDIIEEQRAKLAAEGKVGTPVTAETFALWRAAKLARRQAEIEARVKADQANKGKKGGKQSSVSGKDLFTTNAALFIDDDAADGVEDKDIYAEERRKREEAEEALTRAIAEKARLEQERLFEEQRLEHEAKVAIELERRKKAQASGKTFEYDGIIIKELIFAITEKENFSPFSENNLPAVEVNEDLFNEGDADFDIDDDDNDG